MAVHLMQQQRRRQQQHDVRTHAGQASVLSEGPSLNQPHVMMEAWFSALSIISFSCCVWYFMNRGSWVLSLGGGGALGGGGEQHI